MGGKVFSLKGQAEIGLDPEDKIMLKAFIISFFSESFTDDGFLKIISVRVV
tara:strand:- start:80 stop:232 length:153 start_codon:yes stop_codon:yes gene_type:complete